MKNEFLKALFGEEKIEYFGVIPFGECKIINQPLFDRKVTFKPKTAVFFIVPYYVEDKERNISVYAAARDYHLYFRGLYERLVPRLKEKYGGEFLGFSDNSPIAERFGAMLSGLGKAGEMGQLINERYGSYVFIGELLTDAELETEVFEPQSCKKCGLCKQKCPDERCFSWLNQQKGEVDGKTAELIKSLNCAWGCDICQQVCPMNKDVPETPVEFFKTDRTPMLTCELVENMTDEEFASRAYAWKGRKTILRNLRILENS